MKIFPNKLLNSVKSKKKISKRKDLPMQMCSEKLTEETNLSTMKLPTNKVILKKIIRILLLRKIRSINRNLLTQKILLLKLLLLIIKIIMMRRIQDSIQETIIKVR